MKRIFVTGSTGLVGSRFLELYPDPEALHFPKEIEVDITDPTSLKALFSSFEFEAVVHFAAFTNVSEAEKQRNDESGDCYVVNVIGTKNIVDAVKGKDTKFIHISTDMVFPGSSDDKGPYDESRIPVADSGNLNWYGYTKALAENYVRDNLTENGFVLRINNPVRAYFPDKLDYLRKARSLYLENKLYPLFTDQQISLSFIDDIALAITNLIKTDHNPGTFHVSSKDTTNPHEIIRYYLSKFGKDVNIQTTSMDQSGIKDHRYPMYGGLAAEKSLAILSIPSRTCHEIVDEIYLQTEK